MGLESYEVGEELARVGPSTFMVAKNVLLGHDVLLRRLDIDPARADNVRNTFLREQRLMASFSHAHIQRPLDLFEADGFMWSVHDLRRVRNSQQLTHDRGPMAVSEVARLGAQLADALAHVHAKEHVHGKITPNVVVVDDEGDALLVNFVKSADLKADVWPLREAVLGLSPFSAPEEFHGARADERADLYGLAATLAYWLTQRFPRGATDEDEALEQAQAGAPALDLEQLRPDLPPMLRDRLLEALHADPEQRSGTVAGLASLLSEVHVRTAADIPTGFEIGARLEPEGSLDRVEIQAQHGTGAFGVVFRVRPPGSTTDFALKALKPEHRGDEHAYERFMREARAMQPVQHPNVIRIRGVGELRGTPYCVMDFIDGPDLADVLQREGALPAERVRALASGVAQGLAAIHAEGLVHRDIKPHNVLIAPGDHPVIADFGVAAGALGTRLTMTGQAIGTPAYMAPEQFLDETSTPSIDLWALGVMIFEMLTGALPYEGEGTLDTIRAIRESQVPSLPEDVPGPLAEVTRTLLRKDPRERPASAQVVVEELSRLRV